MKIKFGRKFQRKPEKKLIENTAAFAANTTEMPIQSDGVNAPIKQINETAHKNLNAKKRVICEEKDLREENVKHFLLEDGRHQAVIYPEPVHYFDKRKKRFVVIEN